MAKKKECAALAERCADKSRLVSQGFVGSTFLRRQVAQLEERVTALRHKLGNTSIDLTSAPPANAQGTPEFIPLRVHSPSPSALFTPLRRPQTPHLFKRR